MLDLKEALSQDLKSNRIAWTGCFATLHDNSRWPIDLCSRMADRTARATSNTGANERISP